MVRYNKKLIKQITLSVCVVVLFLICTGFTFSNGMEQLVEAGNNLYSKAKFGPAAEKYSEALRLDTVNAVPLFNRGAANYRLGKFDAALEDCNMAAASNKQPVKNSQLRQYAEYNAGNALFRLKKLDEAIERYKRVLTLDPTDKLAKANLEIAQRAKQSQKQDNKSDKQDQNKQQKPENQKQDQPKQDQQKQDNQQQDQQQKQQPEPQKKPDEGKSSEQSTAGSNEKITKEQAEQLLSSLAREDAQVQKSMRRPAMTKERPTSKDW